MFSYRLFLYCFCILFVSTKLTLGQNNKKCAEFNEYCQNHWDCCSNSCMSYNYRCTRGYNVKPLSYSEALNKPTITLEDLLQMNFGSGKTVETNEINEQFAIDDTTTEIKIVLQNSDGTTEGAHATQLVKDKNEQLFETRIGENEPVYKKEDDPCKEIGYKCYTNEECCSKRCHGFLHKCVT